MRGPLRGPRGPIRLLSGHLGSSVSALVDGQLEPEEAERAWQHVVTCPPCRRLVEHEGEIKRRLRQMRGDAPLDEPSERLVGSLLHLDPAAIAWAETRAIEEAGRGRRRAGMVLVGAGSVSAAVFGLTAIGGAPMGIGGGQSGGGSPPSAPTTTPTLSPTALPILPTSARLAPSSVAHGRLRGRVGQAGGAHR